MAVRIITDSGSDILPDEIEGLTVLPLTVAFGTTVYHDGVDLTHEQFFDLLAESKESPMTSQVPPYDYEQAFKEVVGPDDEAVVITLSSEVSGTYESAIAAAEEFEGKVSVVDSLQVSVGTRLLVEMALQMVEQGASAEEIVARLEEVKGQIKLYALLDTLEYLRRGGRISNVSAALGTLLSIKPVVTVEEGKVVVAEKPRGLKNGRAIIVDLIRKDGGFDFDMPLGIGYIGNSDKPVKKFLESCPDLWEGKGELPVSSVGATIGTHAGPGGMLLAYFPKGE